MPRLNAQREGLPIERLTKRFKHFLSDDCPTAAGAEVPQTADVVGLGRSLRSDVSNACENRANCQGFRTN